MRIATNNRRLDGHGHQSHSDTQQLQVLERSLEIDKTVGNVTKIPRNRQHLFVPKIVHH